jgi:hypothetical protein
MPILRLAYATQFLIALIAIFVLWSQVGGQSHLDLVPWYFKLGLGAGSAFAAVKATAAAVARERVWNSQSLRWLGVLLALLLGCGLASYYAHLSEDEDQEDQQESTALTSELADREACSIEAGFDSAGPHRARDAAASRDGFLRLSFRLRSGQNSFRIFPAASTPICMPSFDTAGAALRLSG